jgi:hypothetical protein
MKMKMNDIERDRRKGKSYLTESINVRASGSDVFSLSERIN